MLDLWKTTALTTITGKHIYTRIHAYPKDKGKEAYAFLESVCIDTAFLNENGIFIVYRRELCSNPNLVQVRNNVYLPKEAGGQ